jgi:hypothetical protein
VRNAGYGFGEGLVFSAAAGGADEESAGAAGEGAAATGEGAAAAGEGAAATGEGAGVEETLREASGEEETEGLTDAWTVADGIGEMALSGLAAGVAFRTSFSSRPTRRPALCLAVRTVNNKVAPKKIHPR